MVRSYFDNHRLNKLRYICALEYGDVQLLKKVANMTHVPYPQQMVYFKATKAGTPYVCLATKGKSDLHIFKEEWHELRRLAEVVKRDLSTGYNLRRRIYRCKKLCDIWGVTVRACEDCYDRTEQKCIIIHTNRLGAYKSYLWHMSAEDWYELFSKEMQRLAFCHYQRTYENIYNYYD